MANGARERDHIILAASEVVFGAGLELRRGLQEKDIVVVGCAEHIVVEMIDNEAGALGGNVNVELEEGSVQGGGNGGGGAQGHQDITTSVEEVEDKLCCQAGTEA